ncbi:PREDICTED: RING-H2 finger protein ATL2-like [Fragaria vesca subsp. vesca]
MSLLFSGILILGVILICFVIYIVFTVAWYLYGRQILSAPTLSQEDPNDHPAAKEKCFIYRKLKPDVITFSYKKELSDDLNQEEESCDQNECVVCLRGLQNEEFVRQLPKCKHTFHAPCIDMWLYSHSECPICRKAIDRLPEEGAFTPGRKSQEVSVDISPSLTLTTISIIC